LVNNMRGFTYLWLLFLLAVGSATLAALGERASAAVLRDRETELLFRGQAIAAAIGNYWQATPGKDKALPASLRDLLDDKRGEKAQRHLRTVYTDPYTGLDNWVLLKDEAAGIVGVHSRADARAFKTASLPLSKRRPDARVSDHVFMFAAAASAGTTSSATAAATPATLSNPAELKSNASE
jgi:type II secretory pathway pseudopilin PulG